MTWNLMMSACKAISMNTMNARILQRDRNLFIIKFHSCKDLLTILDNGPYAVEGGLLVLCRCYDHKDLALGNIWIDKLSVWVRMYGVPITLLNYAGARDLAKRVGEVALVKKDCVFLRKATYVLAKDGSTSSREEDDQNLMISDDEESFPLDGLNDSMYGSSTGASVVPSTFVPNVPDFPPLDVSSPDNVFCAFISAEFSDSDTSTMSPPSIHNISHSLARLDDFVIGSAIASLKCRSKRVQKAKAHKQGKTKKGSSRAADAVSDSQSSESSFCMKIRKAQSDTDIPARPRFSATIKAQIENKANSQGGWYMKVESEDDDESDLETVDQTDSRKCHSEDSVLQLLMALHAASRSRIKLKIPTLSMASVFKNSLVVDSVGHSGGLALFWCDRVQLTVLSQSSNFIVAKVTEATGFDWVAVFLYGLPSAQGRTDFWNQLNNIISALYLPCIILGDFNQVVNQEDKHSGHQVRETDTRPLRKLLITNELDELRHLGCWFTWSNKRQGNDTIFERLDRAFANPRWLDYLGSDIIQKLPILHSGHGPLVIELKGLKKRKPKIRIEQFWSTYLQSNELVGQAWTVPPLQIDSKPKVLSFKMDKSLGNLHRWSKEGFG
ncbi:OLC1v1015827C1 [Oldenlandia corymbosa var. corymbosa]|nr:OLC1v1015827C1 [Oldenlandia corymbosa var. corymbosa]